MNPQKASTLVPLIYFLIKTFLKMTKKVNETGHIKNLTGFRDMIAFVKNYDRYRPTNPLIMAEALGNKYSVCGTTLEAFNQSETSLGEATRKRSAAYDRTRDLGSRIVAALDGSNVPEETIRAALGLNRKLQGRRAKPLEKPPIPAAGEAAAETDNTISVSQQSFDRLAENLKKMRDLVKVQADYLPADEELTVEALTRTISNLEALNTEVGNAEADLAQSRAKLDLEFYDDQGGMLALAKKVKGAVRSIYQVPSVEYRQLTAIHFKNLRKKP